MNIKNFLKECHKRDVFKLLSIYVVSSWIILQVLSVVAEPLRLSENSIPILILLLIIGFPVCIIYIWNSRMSKLWKSEEDDSKLELFNKRKFRQMYFTSIGIILFLAGLAFMVIFNNTFSDKLKLPEFSTNDKISVLTFTNFTLDTKLDIIGEMAANWIMDGITENNAGQIISQQIVKDYSEALKTQNKNFTSNDILNNFFSPGKKITGTYFLNGDQLIFQSSIIDGKSGEALGSVGRVFCDSENPLICIQELGQKIIGYLVSERDKKATFENNPPKYEAYKLVLEAKKSKSDGNLKKYIELLDKAIAIDSEYFEPKSLKVGYYYNNGPYAKADSLIDVIKKQTGISKRQEHRLNMYEAALDGDNRKTYRYDKYGYQLEPYDLLTNTSHMVIALQFANKPEDVEAIFDEVIDIDNFNIENCIQCLDRINLMAMAYNALDQYKKTIKLTESYTDIVDDKFFLMPLFRAYINSNKDDQVDLLLQKLKLRLLPEDWLYLNLFIAREYLLLGNKEVATSYLYSLIQSEDIEASEFLKAEAYSELNDYESATPIYQKLFKDSPSNTKLIVGLSRCYFKNGEPEKGTLLIDALEKQRGPYQYGNIDYRIAQIYAALNNEEKVFEHLLLSIAAGNFYVNEKFKNSSSFIPYLQSEKWNEIMTYWH